MLKFLVLEKGRPVQQVPLRNAYLMGPDGHAIRAEVTQSEGVIICQKREAGTSALAIQFSAGDCGELTLQTCLLPDRDEPYLLSLELARHRLMLLYQKLEDWGLFDLEDEHPVTKRTGVAKKLFIQALCCVSTDLARADKLARESLFAALDGSEELALAHAALLLNKRKASGALPKHPLGCGVAIDQTHERIRGGIQANFDFLTLPTPWRQLAPEEGDYRWATMDGWTEWAHRNRMPIIAGPIVSFDPGVMPDWLYIWEHDYETLRDLIYEHIERMVTRYRNVIHAWNVVSALHVNGHFTFTFDQLIELTRMSVMLVKKIHPASRVLVELCQPFGEYYGFNQRSIPPLMYADLLVQGAVNFDGLSVKLLMGQAMPGQYTRDLMQISNLLDQFSSIGKPVYLTIGVPSETITEVMLAATDPSKPPDANCGHWRKPWSQLVQSHWLEAVLLIAMSKPFIDGVSWHEMADHTNSALPLSGLVSEDMQPKSSLRRLVSFRRSLISDEVLAMPDSPAS